MSDVPATRNELISKLFPDEPVFRLRQIEAATFRPGASGWTDCTDLPAAMRTVLAKDVPWLALSAETVLVSSPKDAFKALLKLSDGEKIESVLMRNRKGGWTACLSVQVGCAMNCAFCATGKLGLKRNLNADEIVDQVRFWLGLVAERKLGGRLGNIVLMGMGEPMANYDNVKSALNSIVRHTDIGPTHITVSTVGLIPQLNVLLDDSDWPPVRLAVSLHSADLQTRQKIMPTTYDRFLDDLADWCRRYGRKFGNRRHHLTFEYLTLAGVNDTPRHAELLADFAESSGRAKINLIPFNITGAEFSGSPKETVDSFQSALERRGITVTVRRSLGSDIAAACGQLAGKI
jgi:adenine C2-methylase RlmN of 23S rRNA A2503 and tRNA A37